MLSGVARRYLAQPGVAFARRKFSCSPLRYGADKLRVAIIGQSLFGLEVYKHLRVLGHEVAGVFTIPGEGLCIHIWPLAPVDNVKFIQPLRSAVKHIHCSTF